MANDRFFSDSIKLEIIKSNLKRHNGSICCELCNTKLNSIDDCHFDHIYPYAKGGKSNIENCQILCSDCNLRKNDKELKDYILEEKAKQFLSGNSIDNVSSSDTISSANLDNSIVEKEKGKRLSKEEFDAAIMHFIDKKGDIHKVDFTRAYNNLPSVWYVREYYGDLTNLKQAFGIVDLSSNWNRDNIKKALLEYVSVHGDVSEKELKKKNGLPSYPCIMKYYSEYNSFSDFKQKELGIENVYKLWTKEETIKCGKEFVEKNGSLTEKDLKAKNGLPTPKVIYRFFGTINDYQRAIDAPVMNVNKYISREDIEKAVNDYFGDNERVVESRKVFFETFPYKPDIVYKRYGSFDEFCSITGIKFVNIKIASYSKRDIDDAIHNWIFSGNDIPKAKELTKHGLPSMSSIMKYYENWKEPFIIYKRIYDEANRNNQ